VKKLYVGNLAFSTTENDLREMFAPYGTVESASLVTDRDTGRSRGFGFVEMTNDSEAASAISGLNGKDSGGRPLTVSEARPKPEHSGGGSRGPKTPRIASGSTIPKPTPSPFQKYSPI